MISIEALAQHGLTNKLLKEVFEEQAPQGTKYKVPTQKKPGGGAPLTTANPLGTLQQLQKLPAKPSRWDIRCYLETLIRDQAIEGQTRCAQKFNRLSAIDLAYSSIPIHPLIHDLMKVAMGNLSLEELQGQIGNLSEESQKRLFERDSQGKVTKVITPQLISVAHNLVHSFVTRRVAALATEVEQQYPLLKYEPFSNNQTGRLVGDVMTQLGEQMAGAYGYRHDYEESIRQASLYTTCIKFKANRWDVEKQSVPVTPPRNGAEKAGRPPKPTYERKIMREGVLFTIPHPSRVYYDISQPLSKLNNDKGPKWLGHWDVVTVGDVLDNPLYFNRESIALDTNVYTFFANYQAYFAQYYGGQFNWENAQKLSPEFCGKHNAALLALANDRVANIGAWAQDYRAVPTVLDQHYMKVIPKDLGLGTYPDPVWIRFVTAANTTVVYAEICGSLPASVNSYNACDGLLENRSFAEDAIQWQQMLTNQLNLLVRAQYQAMVEIWALNKDGMTKGDIDRIVNQLKNPDYTNIANAVMVYSQEKLAQRAAAEPKGADRLTRIQVDNAARIRDIFDQMVQTLAMAERLMFFSPQELGQVSPRTITAEEVKTVNNTTLGIRDFHLVGVKKQMDADKRIIHDSYMAFGSEDLEVPVAERYDPKVIEAAGFEIVDDGSGHPPDGLFTIRGKKLGLYYNYTYTTRNTDDTPPEAAEAQALGQIYEVTSKDGELRALLTNAQKLELFNAFAQKVSPGFQRINLPEGVDPTARGQTQVDQLEQQMKQFLPQIGQALQSQQQQIQQLATKQAESDASMKAVTQALNQLTSAVTGVAKARAGKEPSTARGTVSPTIPRGAPPTGGRAARPVPAL